MSLYDNFRAPQYVDFAGIHNNDNTDASSFFDRDSDMDFTPSVEGSKFSGSSTSSFNGSISDGERTLTPGRFNTSFAGSFGDAINGGDDNHTVTPKKSTISIKMTPLTPADKSLKFGINSPIGSQHIYNESPCIGAFNFPSHRVSTPMATHVNVQVETLKVDYGSPQRKSPRVTAPVSKVSSPSGKTPKTISANYSGNETGVSRKSRCSGITLSCNRRSRSVSDTKTIVTDEEMLNDAIQTLSINSSHKKTPTGAVGEVHNVTSPIQLVPDPISSVDEISEISSKNLQSKVKAGGPKRKLSPPPKNSRDYGQQPAKYISMAEQIAKIQKQTPKRFRTVPSAAALKRGVQSKVARNLSTHPKSATASSGGSASNQRVAQMKVKEQEGSGDLKGVRVARWPEPKVEPFVLLKYKKPELPKTVFSFEQKGSVILRDRKTPLLGVRKTTTIQPFSFDKRDQELLQRKLNRIMGVETQSHCCQTKGRRRSRSQGSEICANTVKQDPLIHHARVPTVLHRPPFVPLKKPYKATRPIDFCLNTEKRAKEREEFDELVKQKGMERCVLLNKQREEKRLQDEKDLLKLRKAIVHKARPVPHVAPFQVYPSCEPLTEPQSPRVLHHSRSVHDM